MEEYPKSRRGAYEADSKDIVVSQSVKAGKRIYYVDVKQSRKGDMFIAITESKKIVSGDDVSYEKHKIFLYKEDFEKFQSALGKAIAFIEAEGQGTAACAGDLQTEDPAQEAKPGGLDDEIPPISEQDLHIDIDF